MVYKTSTLLPIYSYPNFEDEEIETHITLPGHFEPGTLSPVLFGGPVLARKSELHIL